MEIKFCVEDTVDKCYRDFTASLLSKGWKKIPFRKRTKMEKKRFVHLYKCNFTFFQPYFILFADYNTDFLVKMYLSLFVH